MTCRHCRGSSWRRSSRWALGMTALASLLLGDYAKAQALAERAARVLPADVSDQVVQLVLRTKRDSPRLRAGLPAAMVWPSPGAVGVLEGSTSRLRPQGLRPPPRQAR